MNWSLVTNKPSKKRSRNSGTTTCSSGEMLEILRQGNLLDAFRLVGGRWVWAVFRLFWLDQVPTTEKNNVLRVLALKKTKKKLLRKSIRHCLTLRYYRSFSQVTRLDFKLSIPKFLQPHGKHALSSEASGSSCESSGGSWSFWGLSPFLAVFWKTQNQWSRDCSSWFFLVKRRVY